LFNAFIALIYCKLFNKKFIWWSLGKLKNRKHLGVRKLLVFVENLIERKAHAIFTYSTRGKEYFKSLGIDEEKIFVGINVLDTEAKLSEIESFHDDNFTWLYGKAYNLAFIGTITKEKNLEKVLLVIQRFKKYYEQQINFHIIGDGPYMSNLRNAVKQLELEQEVIFYGRINKGASRILAKCDVMVLPGLGGLAICEGMLNKLPIITGVAD